MAPDLFDAYSLTPIEAGWSGDRKYRAEDGEGRRFFLRITPPEKAERAKKAFELQKKIAALGVPVCEPLACGMTGDGFYTLQSWVEGEDAEKVVPLLGEERQYALGYEAGAILRRIHSIPAPKGVTDWETSFGAKIDRNIGRYMACSVKFDGAGLFLSYIAENRRLLAGRPQCFQHGDYHIGNMRIDRGSLVIIDFDRFDCGDPWEEFNRIVWSAHAAPRFAAGTVDGYFEGGVPPGFWKLLALYISSNAIGYIPWAVPFGEREVGTALAQAEEILSWYDGMRKAVPVWYPGKAFPD